MNTVGENLQVKHEVRDQATTPHPTFGEAFRFWLKLGLSASADPQGKFRSCIMNWLNKKNGSATNDF